MLRRWEKQIAWGAFTFCHMLDTCAAFGHLDLVRHLIENSRNRLYGSVLGHTLFVAYMHRHEEICKWLIEHADARIEPVRRIATDDACPFAMSLVSFSRAHRSTPVYRARRQR
jgi:hypothetical protein